MRPSFRLLTKGGLQKAESMVCDGTQFMEFLLRKADYSILVSFWCQVKTLLFSQAFKMSFKWLLICTVWRFNWLSCCYLFCMLILFYIFFDLIADVFIQILFFNVFFCKPASSFWLLSSLINEQTNNYFIFQSSGSSQLFQQPGLFLLVFSR